MKRLMIYIGINNEEVSTATMHVVQNVIKTMTDVDDVRKEREKYEAERIKNPAARMRAWAFLSDKIGACVCVCVCVLGGMSNVPAPAQDEELKLSRVRLIEHAPRSSPIHCVEEGSDRTRPRCVADEDGLKFSHGIFSALTPLLSNAKVSSFGRDNVMELLIKYVTRKEGLNWSRAIIDEGGASINQSINLSIYPSINLSINPSINLIICNV